LLMIRRRLSLSLLLLILSGAVLSVVPNLQVEEVLAVPVSPYIMIIPEQTLNSTITPGMNYTISIYADYGGSDVWGWQLGLNFNPAILQGLQVLNGDLITTAKNSRAKFYPGTFDNTLGILSTTVAFFYNFPYPAPTTSGPGTLAYVKFRVVGTGISDLTLSSAAPSTTQLQGYSPDPPSTGTYYNIITADGVPGASNPPYGSDHIGHGNFNNIPYGHDVAVTNVVAPASAIIGDNVAVNVTVANEGSFTETFNLTVAANATQVGNQTVTDLASGQSETLTFMWNTTDITAGNYVINATAWLTDMDMSDNSKNATIEIRTLHDVAIINLQAPSEAIVGDFIAINVTVANQGTFEEDVNLTVTYQLNVPSPPLPTMINTTIFQLAKRPTSKMISADWNTTGIAKGTYKINATITIAQDEEPSDNSQRMFVQLQWGHDVAITDVSANSSVFIGEPVTINVTVKNVGSFEETFNVTVTYGSSNILIGTQQVASLTVDNSVVLPFVWSTIGLSAGNYVINATAWLITDSNLANNYLPDSVVVATPIGHIAGVVEDASTGEPLEGVQVSAGAYFDVTDADGYYNITNVPTGNYTVTASKSGFQTSSTANVNVVSRQTIDLDFPLTRIPTSGNIAGTVTDATTRNPIEGVNVTVSGYFDITDQNGRYNITNVPAATYTVTASKDGYQSSSSTNVVVTAGQTRTLNFQLTAKPTDIIPYVAIVVIVIVVIVGIALYLRKTRKAK